MSPHDIRKFNEEQKKQYWDRTQISVDIQNLGKNTQCIAVREEDSLKEIQQGVWMRKECKEFCPNNFTNIYDLLWNPAQATISPVIHSSNTPYFLVDQIEKDPSTIATINGGFFFLADIADRAPIDLPYDLCIRNGKTYGLPSEDRPVAYIENGALNVQDVDATGTILIGKKEVPWVGAKSNVQKTRNTAILYNSRCSEVTKVRDENNIQIGILDSEHITTPKNPDVVDIVIGKDSHDNLIVTHINNEGNTHFFDGLFILQIAKKLNTFKIGDSVTPLTVGTLQIQKISSGITIGRSVHSSFFLEDVRVGRRDARSLIAKDVNGHIHFIVFDGSKYIPGFRGVSAQDISQYFSPDRFQWAYFLDGGGSTRIIVRDEHELQFVANEFAFRKLGDGTILWDWKKARLLTSSILLRNNDN